VLALDADDLIAPTFIEDCVVVLDARHDATFAYGSLRLFGVENGFFPVSQYDLIQLTRRNQFPCTALLRRSAWADVGGYDEQLTGYEDWDLWLGCAERGYFGMYVPYVVFYYRKREHSMLVGALERDPQLKAQIVLNHPVLFSPEQATWARGVLDADRHALTIDETPGEMPTIGEIAVRAPRSGGSIEGARRFVTLALAQEVVDRPALLAAYGAHFSGDDDATLVICGSEPDLARLGQLVENLRLDGSRAADLVGVVVDDTPASFIAVATKVDALLTRRPLRLPVALPRVDDARVRDLRMLVKNA